MKNRYIFFIILISSGLQGMHTGSEQKSNIITNNNNTKHNKLSIFSKGVLVSTPHATLITLNEYGCYVPLITKTPKGSKTSAQSPLAKKVLKSQYSECVTIEHNDQKTEPSNNNNNSNEIFNNLIGSRINQFKMLNNNNKKN